MGLQLSWRLFTMLSVEISTECLQFNISFVNRRLPRIKSQHDSNIKRDQYSWKTPNYKILEVIDHTEFTILSSQWISRSVRLKSTVGSFFGMPPHLLLLHLANDNSVRLLSLSLILPYKVFFMSWDIIKNNVFMVWFIHVKVMKLKSHIEKLCLQKDCDASI